MTARISIDGNLAADPDFGVGDSGTRWTHLRVASHERIRKDGAWVSTDPEYYNVTLFGEAAEAAANDLHKGDRVNLTGRPQLEMFDRRDGSAGAAVKVYTRTVTKAPDAAAAPDGAGDWDIATDPTIRIDDPADPHGPPAYEGPVSAAKAKLEPGMYQATTLGDDGTAIGAPVKVRVTGTIAYIDTRSDAPSGLSAEQPRIHHTAAATAVVGVGKTATAMHKTLKDNGFRWSTATASWNLPGDLDEHTRAARVSELLSTVRANGRDLPVVNEPAPQAPPKSKAVATAGVPTVAVAAVSAQRSGRSL